MSKKELLTYLENFNSYSSAAKPLKWDHAKLIRYVEKKGWRKDADAALAKSATGTKVPTGVVSREEILEQQVSELQSELKSTRKDTVLEERLFERFSQAIEVVEPRYVEPKVGEKDYDPHEFVLLFSDTHAAEVVDRESTLGMNEYNWDIMLKRMAKIQKSVISYHRNRPYPVSKLTVALLGDMLSGDIHEELQITNDRTVEEAVVQLANDTARFLQGFVPYFPEPGQIKVVGVPGNHPRRAKKPQAKLSQNNADWLMYRFVEALLKDQPQFEFDFPRAHYATTMIADNYRLLITHGDGIRSTMPGVPWGGVVRRITTLEQQFQNANMPIDYFALGHFHTVNTLEGVGSDTFLNGSVKGLDEYSLHKFGSGRPPKQVLLTFHPRNGHTDTSNIDLSAV